MNRYSSSEVPVSTLGSSPSQREESKGEEEVPDTLHKRIREKALQPKANWGLGKGCTCF